jgi:phosphonate transport system substrate-binding protein
MKFMIQSLMSVLLTVSAVCTGEGRPALNVGFSEDFFHGINQNNAIAAMKVWSDSVARNRGIPINSGSTIYSGSAALSAALTNGEVDVLMVLSSEMIALRDLGLLEPKFVSMRNGSCQEQYLVLVHRDSGITDLAGLKQKNIIIQSSARASLARPWFEEMMNETGPVDLSRNFASFTETPESSRIVLPVFFKKADACIVSRSTFKTLAELNPQLTKQLVALAESPGFVPTVFCMRKGYDSELLPDLMAGLADLHKEPHGQQILMLFKVDELAAYDAGHMASTEKLLAKKSSAAASIGLPTLEINHD